MEGQYARRAFPCFDESSFKATFDITLRHQEEYPWADKEGLLNWNVKTLLNLYLFVFFLYFLSYKRINNSFVKYAFKKRKNLWGRLVREYFWNNAKDVNVSRCFRNCWLRILENPNACWRWKNITFSLILTRPIGLPPHTPFA